MSVDDQQNMARPPRFERGTCGFEVCSEGEQIQQDQALEPTNCAESRQEAPRVQHSIGWVYFIQARTGGPVKIGFAVDLSRRLSELQVGSPVLLRLLGSFAGTRADEAALHEKLATFRSHGEWFVPGPDLRAVLAERLCQIPEMFIENPTIEIPRQPQRRKAPAPLNPRAWEDRMLARIRERDPAEARRLTASWRKSDARMAKRRCRHCGELMGRCHGEHKRNCAKSIAAKAAATLACMPLLLAAVFAFALLGAACATGHPAAWCRGAIVCLDPVGRRIQTWQEKIQAEIDADLRALPQKKIGEPPGRGTEPKRSPHQSAGEGSPSTMLKLILPLCRALIAISPASASPEVMCE